MSNGAWAAISALYDRPGVREVCLRLQDERGLPVTALLFTLARASRGLRIDASVVAELAMRVESDVTRPLRAARRALPVRGTDPKMAAALRASVLAAELEAERLALEALDGLAGGWGTNGALTVEESLAALAAACGATGEATAGELRALVEAACQQP